MVRLSCRPLLLYVLAAFSPVELSGCTAEGGANELPVGPVAAAKENKMSAKANVVDLKRKLTPEQFHCTQENGTERPFHNAYWDNHAAGIYVDVVDGRPLFLSADKFESHSGWPSFTRAIGDSVIERLDSSHGMQRREARSRVADSHLGHVFDDGPAPGHQRFCINSASLRFIAAGDMAREGYSEYLFALASSIGAQTATLAGGCFWGVEELFAEQPGVLATQVGYAGGQSEQTTYQQVTTGTTGHAEAVQILFDPKQTSYAHLLAFFFRMHDPTTPDRQKNDRGSQYRSAIFTHSDEQRKLAEQMLAKAAASKHFAAPIVTQVAPLTHFIRAEKYHQHYLDKHKDGYRCHEVAPWTLAP